tara:strand:+ start:742 stop:2595 length:1854 start_codon:yes stop_codon:yes gene_type:complete
MKNKEVKYLGRDFGDFREGLIDFAKNYFPDTYNDFNETSPGMMFMEMSSYVGDVLSYYTDYQLKESLLSQAQERSNILDIANSLGYKAKSTAPAHVELCVYLWLPATGSAGAKSPDMRYALTIPQGMVVSGGGSGTEFTTLEDANFANTGSVKTEVSVYSLDDNDDPDAFLVKTKVKAISGQSVIQTYNVTAAKKFDKFKLNTNDVIAIESVTDADSNIWYEVPYLAQDTIFEQVANKASVDQDTAADAADSPYLLKLRRTARRFTTRINRDNYTELNFGAGVSSSPDELIVPNPSTIGNVLEIGNAAQLDVSFDPANMMHTRAYGQAPASALTIRYLRGGGIASNIPSGVIDRVVSRTINLDEDGLDASVLTVVKESLAVTNEYPATGGRSAETNEEIRQNALGAYASQNRAVTKEDYVTRVYAMPSKYGSIAKAYVASDDKINNSTDANPLALNMYVLSYDDLNNLATTNTTAKKNLQTYLSQYRILTDGINIRNGFPINIGIDFEIVVLPSFNGKEVLAQTIDMIKKYFDIDKWQFNQPIMIGDLVAKMSVVEGVQAVSKIDIKNNASIDSGYSGNSYNIGSATINNVVYPSQDPCIFEVKYPDKDIRGKIVGF